MKRQYIQLATMIQQIHPIGTVCVGSVHGTEGLKHGGAADPSNPEQQPF